MKVRVGESAHVAAARTLVARWGSARAEQSLGEPEGETLLSDAPRTVEKKAGREGVGVDTLGESPPEDFVSVQVDQRHPSNMANAYRAWHVF